MSMIRCGAQVALLAWAFAAPFAAAETLHRYDADTSASLTRTSVTYGRVPSPGSTLRHRWVVAGRDADGRLRVEGHRFTSTSRRYITRDWLTGAGSVSRVSVGWVGASGAHGDDDRFITAVRDSNGRLRLILWEHGRSTRLGTATFRPAIRSSQIDTASLYNGYFVTAAREADDDIRIDLWRVTSDDRIVHRTSAIAGSGSWANVVNAEGRRVVAVFRNTSGQLTTQMFSINDHYDDFDYHSGWVSSQAGEVKARAWNDRFIVAAFETASDQLGVYFFDTQGGIHFHSSNIQSGHTTGTISDLAISRRGKLATAVRDSAGHLKLLRWDLSADGSVERLTDNEVSGYPMGDATHVLAEGGSGIGSDLSTHNQLLTGGRDSNDELRLTVFHSN